MLNRILIHGKQCTGKTSIAIALTQSKLFRHHQIFDEVSDNNHLKYTLDFKRVICVTNVDITNFNKDLLSQFTLIRVSNE